MITSTIKQKIQDMNSRFIRFLLFNLMLMHSTGIYSQNLFEYNTLPENIINSCRIWETPQGNIFFIAGYYNIEENNNYSYYGMLNSNGEELWKKRISRQHLADIITIQDDVFVLGRERNPAYTEAFVHINKLSADNQLEHISSILSECNNTSGKVTKAILDSDTNFVVFSFTHFDFQIMRIDKNGNKITETCYPGSERLFDLIENPEKKTYTGICLMNFQLVYVKFDYHFNIIEILPQTANYLHQNNLRWVNDTTLLTIGKRIGYLPAFIGAEYRNQYFDPIMTSEITNPEGYDFYPAFHKNHVFPEEGDFFYIAATKNPQGYPKIAPGWISIAKVNKTSLDFEWVKYYGGGNYYYQAMAIEQISDGGLIISGSRANIIEPIREESIVIIKTDPEGNFPLSAEPGQENFNWQFTVFPNPGTNMGVEASIEGATLQLFDLNGRSMYTQELYTGHNPIHASLLKPGTYIYRIIFQNQVLGSGKWVKM